MSEILDFIAWSTKARLENDPEWGGKMKRQEERIKELEFALKWQPIETAPRNGTEILIHCRGNAQYVALWNGIQWVDGSGQRLDPTHWMPLPEPPR